MGEFLMLRTLLAAVALSMVCCSASFAGHGCLGCGGGGGHAWNNYCGDPCSSCNTCDSCHGGGCHRCCFPLVRGTLRVVAKAVNFVIPRPCCRSSSCCDAGWDPCGGSCGGDCDSGCDSCGGGDFHADHHNVPSYAPARAGNPFQDDAPAMTPTPAPARDARNHPGYKSPIVKTTPASSRNVVTKRAVPTPAALPKPTVIAKPIPRTIVKVAHVEEVEEALVSESVSDDDGLSAPNAPRSIRLAEREEVAPLPLPRVNSTTKRSSNPLR
jgi:hypothetical protein